MASGDGCGFPLQIREKSSFALMAVDSWIRRCCVTSVSKEVITNQAQGRFLPTTQNRSGPTVLEHDRA
jgi:hypothetical protein